MVVFFAWLIDSTLWWKPVRFLIVVLLYRGFSWFGPENNSQDGGGIPKKVGMIKLFPWGPVSKDHNISIQSLQPIPVTLYMLDTVCMPHLKQLICTCLYLHSKSLPLPLAGTQKHPFLQIVTIHDCGILQENFPSDEHPEFYNISCPITWLLRHLHRDDCQKAISSHPCPYPGLAKCMLYILKCSHIIYTRFPA